MRFVAMKRNADFTRCYKKGKAYVSPAIVMYVLKTRRACTRVGLTASKKVGHAVVRNRARRVMREAIAAHLDPAMQGYDLVFVARACTPELKAWQVSAALGQLFAKAGLPDRAAQEKNECSAACNG